MSENNLPKEMQMEAKAKTKELVEKFQNAIFMGHPTLVIDEDTAELAKSCAIICVDEILDSISPKGFPNERYWQQVKEEIKNL